MLEKCTICGQLFPQTTLKKMIQTTTVKKAYLHKICPSCQSIVLHNPSYYYLIEARIK